ncbi:MAG: DUF4335 domain-containing protein [Microcystaceae cyanobacterium]
MNLKRQYSLPNCTLTLDGLEGASLSTDSIDNRPVLSILTNMDCFFVGQPNRMMGGRDLLDNLVKSVSLYAQTCLSGLSHPPEETSSTNQVQLEAIAAQNRHRLTWYPEGSDQPQTLELSTIQLFDLIEAVDQLVADQQTLPELSIVLKPVSRRYRQPDEPMAQRVIPAVVGLLSLVIVGSIGFMLPIPEVERPAVEERPATETLPQPTNTEE